VTDLVIDRKYSIGKEDRDKVTFSLHITPDALAPGPAGLQFSLEYLLITEEDAKRKAKNPKAKPTPGNPQTDFMVAGEAEPGKPILDWSAYGEQTFFIGKMKARFDWADSGGAAQFAETEFDAGNFLNTQQSIVLSSSAPKLSDILQNTKPPEMTSTAGASLERKVVDVLVGVNKRLEAGLKDAWILGGAPTKNGKSYVEVPIAELTTPEEVEEAWAEHVSELLTATNYAGCGPTYGTKDSEVFRKTTDNDDPGAAMVYACQMLATMGCITRGLDDAAVDPLDSSDATPVTRYKRGAAGTGTLNTDSANKVAATAIANGVLAPGICYVVSDIRHIAFILRGVKPDRLQMIDTAAMWTKDPSSDVPFDPNGGLNYDTPAAKEITKSIKHIGVLPKAAALRSAVARLRRTRPLGTGRLVLLRRDTNSGTAMRERLLYASPAIPLWDPSNPERNYYQTHLCWSLRDQVHRDVIAAWWLVNVPMRDPMRSKIFGSRTFTWDPYDKTKAVPTTESLSIADIASTDTGGFKWTGRLAYTTKNNPKGETLYRGENGKSTNAWVKRRDSTLEGLPIDAIHPGPDDDNKFVLRGCALKPDGTINDKDPKGFPKRVVFKYADFADFPALFRSAP
jgi:hypothetical protein